VVVRGVCPPDTSSQRGVTRRPHDGACASQKLCHRSYTVNTGPRELRFGMARGSERIAGTGSVPTITTSVSLSGRLADGGFSMPTTDSTREARLLRRARMQGLILRKSRRRVREALDYGQYWLIEPNGNYIVAGGEWGWSLDDIEDDVPPSGGEVILGSVVMVGAPVAPFHVEEVSPKRRRWGPCRSRRGSRRWAGWCRDRSTSSTCRSGRRSRGSRCRRPRSESGR
jgi:hypothetical protein